MMDTYSKVKNAFYSGEHAFTGDNQVASDIAFLVDNGYLALHLFPLATRQEYLTALHGLSHQKHVHEAAGGGEAHIALKLLAGDYLRRKHGKDALYEHPVCGYFPDVMTVDNRVVVECGHTHNPEKIFTYFKQGHVEECILVPYPDPEEQGVTAYSFTALSELIEFLNFWESEKNSAIKNRLRQRR